MRTLLAITAVLPLSLGLVACGGKTVDTDKAEKEISAGYEKQVKGAQVESIECPDLDAKTGEKGTCKMTLAKDVQLDVSLEVTSEEDNGKIRWTVVAGTLPGSLVEEKAATALEGQVGRAPDLVSCPERVNIKVGSTTRCEVTADAQTYGATVTITDESGGFDIKVDEQPTT